MEIEVDQLADVLFVQNINNSVVEMSLGGIEDNKDLFYFCLDLFCKGLVILFGKNNTIIINDITSDQFELIKTKMGNAGIRVDLNVIAKTETFSTEINIDDDSPSDIPETLLFPNVNIQHIELMPDDLDLTQYNFEINLNKTLKYVITFNLFHRVV